MSKTILIADDSSSILIMVQQTLTQAGYQVLQAKDGQEALERFKASPTQMVITDLNMPRMSGIELIKELRAHPQGKFIPLVLLTTESDETKKQQGRAAGATAWIHKPFNPTDLLGVVKKVLG